MSRIFGVTGLYALMFCAWMGVGLYMVLAPVRFGNLIHDSFELFPEVRPSDWFKKLVVRLAGLGLLGFAVRFAIGIVALAF